MLSTGLDTYNRKSVSQSVIPAVIQTVIFINSVRRFGLSPGKSREEVINLRFGAASPDFYHSRPV